MDYDYEPDPYEESKKRYRNALLSHPHPADPDHPDPEEYGIEDDEE